MTRLEGRKFENRNSKFEIERLKAMEDGGGGPLCPGQNWNQKGADSQLLFSP